MKSKKMTHNRGLKSLSSIVAKFLFAIKRWGLPAAVFLLFVSRSNAVDQGLWTTTWACGVQLTEPHNLPPVALDGCTLRQFVYCTLSGQRLRVRISNEYGTGVVKIAKAHIALARNRGSAGNGEIDPDTDVALKFNGSASVSIPAGEIAISDPVDFQLPSLTNLAISIYFENVPRGTITGHPGSRTTSFIQSGDVVNAPSMPQATRVTRWYFIAGVDVWSSNGAAIVTLGDSLTDGRGSTTDGNDRWPDVLARRLATNLGTAYLAVVNMGIGGNAVLKGGLGPTAVSRFDRDVLGTCGVRWVIIFEGINDIGGAPDEKVITVATNLVEAYTQFAQKAHQKNVRAFICTLTPFGGHSYYTHARETARQFVNAWIRTNSVFDGVIDFDAVVRDPTDPTRLLPQYDSGDHLHLSPAGYHAMAESIDLQIFAR